MVFNQGNYNLLEQSIQAITLGIAPIAEEGESEALYTNPDSRVENYSYDQIVNTTFDWQIPNFYENYINPGSEDKIASNPFCTENARMQAVIFPRGVGCGADTHLSLFLRPIKSNDEVQVGDEWYRDISWITVSIIKFNPDTQLKEMYYQVSYGGEGEIEILGFRGPGGHGFGQETFISRQDVGNLLESDGSLNFQISVGFYQRVNLDIVNHVFHSCFSNVGPDSSYVLPAFGLVDNLWQILTCMDGGRDGAGNQCMSVYLKPIKSKLEIAMGPSWKRVITGVTIKLLQGSQGALVASKIFTGSFVFSDEEKHDLCGWPLFVTSDSIVGPLQDYTLTVSVLIDSKANTDHFIEPFSRSLLASWSTVSQLKEENSKLQASFQDNIKQLKSLRNVEEFNAALKTELEKAQQQSGDWAKIVDDMKEEVLNSKESAHLKTGEVSAMRVTVANVKARLMHLRILLEDGPDTVADEESWDNVTDEADSSPSSSDSKVVVGNKKKKSAVKAEMVPLTEHLKLQSKLAGFESQIAALNAKLIAAESERDKLQWEWDHMQKLPDSLYIPTLPADDELYDSDSEEVGGQDILETMNSLVKTAKDSIQKAADRSAIQIMDPFAKALDLASVTADLATVQAELEIARVPFIEIASKAASTKDLVGDPKKLAEIQRVNNELDSVRFSLINTLYEVESNHGSSWSISGNPSMLKPDTDMNEKLAMAMAENNSLSEEVSRLKTKIEMISAFIQGDADPTAISISPNRNKPIPAKSVPPTNSGPSISSGLPNDANAKFPQHLNNIPPVLSAPQTEILPHVQASATDTLRTTSNNLEQWRIEAPKKHRKQVFFT